MSLTIQGLFFGVIILIAQGVGVEVGSAELTATLATLGKLLAAGMIYWGRIRQGDVNWLGVKQV